MKEKYSVIGVMSGTSLDGVDLAFCEFEFSGKWSFKIIQAETIPYDEQWKKRLETMPLFTAAEISEYDFLYGYYLGKLVKHFITNKNINPDFISSHGHTIFHQPANRFTKQIGNGAAIAAECGYTVICDFRTMDIALGGQGAPLVPAGDKLLFPESEYCLNLGGIANISFEENNSRVAFDICGCNQVLNYYAGKRNMSFDRNGELAASGKIDESLLTELNNIEYYRKPFPKSLGREDIEKNDFRIIEKHQLKTEDALSTYAEHVAIQISKVTNTGIEKEMLLTGGGAFNGNLVDRIRKHCKGKIIIPEKEIIEFKEALIFAFLGVLRMMEIPNALRSVTGASKDSCGGCIYKF